MALAELPLHADSTLGPLLIGGLVAAAFWGVTSAQTYIYYQRYPKDPLSLKLIVALLWVLDTFDVCLTSHTVYHYLVTNYLNPLAIITLVWSILIHIAVTSVTDAIIRFMFIQRVWKLSGENVILTSIVGGITLCNLVVGISITLKAFVLLPRAHELDRISTLLYVNFGAEISGDLFVAIILCYYLFASRTGFRRTDTLLNTLIAYIVTTGLLTSVDAILGLVFYATMPRSFIFIGFYFNLAKMYINSYLALLSDQPYTTNFGPEMLWSGRIDKLPHGEMEVYIQTTVDTSTEEATDALSAYLAATKNRGSIGIVCK